MNMRFLLVAWMPFLAGCSDEAIDQDAVVNDPTYRQFVSYHGGDTGTYMIYQGYKYDVRIDGDYIVFEQLGEAE